MMQRDRRPRIVFFSTLNGYRWGGSEELWSRTATELVSRGFAVSASVKQWPSLHERVVDLQARGVELWPRPAHYSLRDHPWHRLASRGHSPVVYEFKRLIAARPPALVVFSEGGPLPLIELLEICVAKQIPFVTIGQANWEAAWKADDVAERYRIALAAALRCYFVSKSNLWLAEKQIGADLPNAEVVGNPVNIPYDTTLDWPPSKIDDLRFACVGRLDPPSKGQDILFEALAASVWRERRWRLNLYGEGPMRQGLEWLARKLGMTDRVVFAGFSPVEEIWSSNHVLVMPSRAEGLPLAMVEAMLCARPVIATDVAGHSEIVEDGVSGFLADAPNVRAVTAALERFWERRSEAEEIGIAGARKIREIMPPDPVRIFSDKLLKVAGLWVKNL